MEVISKIDRLKVVAEINLKHYFQSIEYFRLVQPLNRVFDSYIRMNLVRLARSLDPRSIFLMNGNGLNYVTSLSTASHVLVPDTVLDWGFSRKFLDLRNISTNVCKQARVGWGSIPISSHSQYTQIRDTYPAYKSNQSLVLTKHLTTLTTKQEQRGKGWIKQN